MAIRAAEIAQVAARNHHVKTRQHMDVATAALFDLDIDTT
jgi:hypothetical protein